MAITPDFLTALAFNDEHGVSRARSRRFVDPDQFQAEIRGGDNMYSILGRGSFRAELTDINVGPLLLQRGTEALPRLASTSMPPNRVGILGWFSDGQMPIVRGAQMQQGEFMCLGLGMQSHHRTFGHNEFAALTLDATSLTAAAMDLTGRELAVTGGKVLRPPDHLGTWLMSVIDTATRVVMTTPGIVTAPSSADALLQALLRPLITCLMDGESRNEGVSRGHRAAIARRFAEAVEASLDRPLLILELALPGTTRYVSATLPGATTIASDATGTPASRPFFDNGHGDRNELWDLGTRAICRGLQGAVRGIAVVHIAPAARIITTRGSPSDGCFSQICIAFDAVAPIVATGPPVSGIFRYPVMTVESRVISISYGDLYVITAHWIERQPSGPPDRSSGRANRHQTRRCASSRSSC
jgi:hypothetical protein